MMCTPITGSSPPQASRRVHGRAADVDGEPIAVGPFAGLADRHDHPAPGRPQSTLVSHHQPYAGLSAGPYHLPAFRDGVGHRLFTVDVATSACCRDGDLAMRVIGAGDRHHVDVFIGEQCFMIVVPGHVQAGGLTEPDSSVGVRIGQGHDITELADVTCELWTEVAGAENGKSQPRVVHGSFHLTTSVTVFCGGCSR